MTSNRGSFLNDIIYQVLIILTFSTIFNYIYPYKLVLFVYLVLTQIFSGDIIESAEKLIFVGGFHNEEYC